MLNTPKESELLRTMFELANFVPASLELSEFSSLDSLYKEFPDVGSFVKRFSPDLESEAALKGFQVFVHVREFMKVLVEYSEAYRTFLDQEKEREAAWNPNLLKRHQWEFSIAPMAIGDNDDLSERFFKAAYPFIKVMPNSSHSIELRWDTVARDIEGADLRRFRKCKTCERFFWAYRLDSTSCSRKCSNILYQRRYQSDERKREIYNRRRRETYQSKIEQKRGKERRNKDGSI